MRRTGHTVVPRARVAQVAAQDPRRAPRGFRAARSQCRADVRRRRTIRAAAGPDSEEPDKTAAEAPAIATGEGGDEGSRLREPPRRAVRSVQRFSRPLRIRMRSAEPVAAATATPHAYTGDRRHG